MNSGRKQRQWLVKMDPSGAVYAEHPSIGVICAFLSFGFALSFVLYCLGFPSTAPVTIFWSAAVQDTVDGKLRHGASGSSFLWLPKPDEAAVVLYANVTSGNRCVGSSSSVDWRGQGIARSFERGDDDDVSGGLTNWWLIENVEKQLLEGEQFYDDTEYLLEPSSKAFPWPVGEQMAVVLFPMYARSGLVIYCEGGSAEVELSMPDAGYIGLALGSESEKVYVQAVPLSDRQRVHKVRIRPQGPGRFDVALRTHIVYETVQQSVARASVTVESESSTNCGTNDDASETCAALRGGTLLKIATADVTQIDGMEAVGGYVGLLGTAVGLFVGLLAAARLLAGIISGAVIECSSRVRDLASSPTDSELELGLLSEDDQQDDGQDQEPPKWQSACWPRWEQESPICCNLRRHALVWIGGVFFVCSVVAHLPFVTFSLHFDAFEIQVATDPLMTASIISIIIIFFSIIAISVTSTTSIPYIIAVGTLTVGILSSTTAGLMQLGFLAVSHPDLLPQITLLLAGPSFLSLISCFFFFAAAVQSEDDGTPSRTRPSHASRTCGACCLYPCNRCFSRCTQTLCPSSCKTS